jgi:hypothetical protein
MYLPSFMFHSEYQWIFISDINHNICLQIGVLSVITISVWIYVQFKIHLNASDFQWSFINIFNCCKHALGKILKWSFIYH